MAKIQLSSQSSIRTNNSSIGTSRWRAPETMKRNQEWSEKSDIFALGMTFFEIATRKIPFEEENDNSMVISWIRDLK